MKIPVLIDSSAWVEVVRSGGNPGMVARVEGLISSGLAAMTEPVSTSGLAWPIARNVS